MNGTAINILKWLVLALVLIALMGLFFWPLVPIADAEPLPAVWFLVVISAIANIVVMGYHHLVPPHPKFLMIPWRRVVIHVHIYGGTLELTFGLIACFTGAPWAAVAMALAALTMHIPSAALQTPFVFGDPLGVRSSGT